MNKSERLNDLMIFLSDKTRFNLADMMARYDVSRSTAIRDVAALETLGMPVFSQPGRNGYYGLMPNRLLSPIVFNMEEVYALYFAMLTLRDYQSTPFHLSVEALKEKFEACLSGEKREGLRGMEKVLAMSGLKHFNQSPWLKDIVGFAVEGRPCVICYKKGRALKEYSLQFITVSTSFGQWYATAFNFETGRPQVFRCDKITGICETAAHPPQNPELLRQLAQQFFSRASGIPFQAEITAKGCDFFHKEHYPSMALRKEGERYFVQGRYHEEEEAFLASYLIGFGPQVLFVYPPALSMAIVRTLQEMTAHHKKIAQEMTA